MPATSVRPVRPSSRVARARVPPGSAHRYTASETGHGADHAAITVQHGSLGVWRIASDSAASRFSKTAACSAGTATTTASKRAGSRAPFSSRRRQPPWPAAASASPGAGSTAATWVSGRHSAPSGKWAASCRASEFIDGTPNAHEGAAGALLASPSMATHPLSRQRATCARNESVVAVNPGAPWSKAPASLRRVAQRPPAPRLFSNRVTDQPPASSPLAAVRPAMPAPITATRFIGVLALTNSPAASASASARRQRAISRTALPPHPSSRGAA